MNIKKLFAILAGVSMVANVALPGLAQAATPDNELGKAYEWAYSKGITTMDSFEKANMYGNITRAEMSKMLSVYAKTFLGKTADTSKECKFSDIDSVKGDLHDYIIESCQLGIMGQNITAFRPYDTLSRAEFGTALSRALWGDKHNTGTPYYAAHLNALKEAGIMNQINNADSTKEIRGYVMIMLQRASGEEDKDLCEMCLATGIGEEKCEAVCGNSEEEETNDNGKVRSGDLAVTAEAAEGKKVLTSGISDMDTITFKTSENVEISKITLERYGYNSDDSTKIKGIWLEDEDGNIIAESKTLTKDKVTLNIKKDYRKVDGTYVATVVIETDNASKGTIGFKVTDVEHTAKNLNLENYSPYTYEIIDYTGAAVTVEVKGSVKNYNYEEGNSYEVARLKVKANGGKDILVKGFTLTNNLKGEVEKALDMKEFLDELTVTVDSKEVKAKATVNKDDELVVSFSEDVEIAMNKSALFVFSASFKDFDAYGDAVRYEIAKTSDVNAIEKKNETRVTLDITNAKVAKAVKHVFAGGKIKLSNKKLGNIDAAQASEGTIIAEWDVTVTEPLSKLEFTVTANENGRFIDNLTMVVNGEEYEATKASDFSFTAYPDDTTAASFSYWKVNITSTNGTIYWVKVIENSVDGYVGNTYYIDMAKVSKSRYQLYTDAAATASPVAIWVLPVVDFNFKNVEIEKSGKIQFKVDIKDQTINWSPVINFVNGFGKAAFDWAKYDNTNKYVQQGDVAGSISFSKVTIQPAKASLNNSLSKNAEFVRNETNKKIVLEWEYTAKKGEVDLNKFYVTNTTTDFGANKPTFYLYIEDMENPVADTDIINASTVTDATANAESFSDFTVEAGKTVKVKVEAEVEAYAAEGAGNDDLGKFTVVILGTDANGNEDTGRGSAKTVTMKVVNKGSITVSGGTSKNTVLKKAAGEEIAAFTIKPSKWASEVELEDLVFTLTKNNGADAVITTEDDLTIKVGKSPLNDCTLSNSNKTVTCSITNETLESEGKDVSIVLDEEVAGTIVLQLVSINDKEVTNKFTKRFESALVSVESQTNNGGTTTFVLDVQNDDDLTISHLQIKFDTPVVDTLLAEAKDSYNLYYDVISDGDDLTDIKWVKDTPRLVDEISYFVKKKAGSDYADCAAAGWVEYTTLPTDADVTAHPDDPTQWWTAGAGDWCKLTITRAQYADFFKIGGTNVQAFASNK